MSIDFRKWCHTLYELQIDLLIKYYFKKHRGVLKNNIVYSLIHKIKMIIVPAKNY
jgi:hypothetical protein